MKNRTARMIGLDEKGLAKATRLGLAEWQRGPVQLEYDASFDTLVVTMPTGSVVIIPRQWISEVADLPKAVMQRLYLSKLRDSFEIDEYDIQISAMGLLRDAIFGEDPYAKAGRVTSPAKARAARRNGAKGGRPRKKARR